MPNVNDLVQSKYLKKSDLGPHLAALLTIKSGEVKNVAPPGAPADNKFTLSFHEIDKTMPLNKTNLFAFSNATGADNTDHWPGKKVVMFWDPSVQFKGSVVGGIRVRAPKAGAVPPPIATVQPDFDDQIPF